LKLKKNFEALAQAVEKLSKYASHVARGNVDGHMESYLKDRGDESGRFLVMEKVPFNTFVKISEEYERKKNGQFGKFLFLNEQVYIYEIPDSVHEVVSAEIFQLLHAIHPHVKFLNSPQCGTTFSKEPGAIRPFLAQQMHVTLKEDHGPLLWWRLPIQIL